MQQLVWNVNWGANTPQQDPRKLMIMQGVKSLAWLFQIEVWKEFSIERCVIDKENTLHSFGFFDKVHSEIEGAGFVWLRGYTLTNGTEKVFFTYQENITKSQVPMSVKTPEWSDVIFWRVICLEDIMKHPQKDMIFKILSWVSDIEKQNRAQSGIATTGTDERVHEVLKRNAA